jgi:hypothetical protein
MTKAVSFTRASVRRAIEAARKAGLRVTAIRPDGTVVVNDGENPLDSVAPLAPDGDTAALAKWGDVQA